MKLMGIDFEITEAERRVRQMERCFDLLMKAVNDDADALREDETLREAARKLTEYYESGQWLRDYELDEKGFFPQSLKRGVLAQDGLYELLERIGDILN